MLLAQQIEQRRDDMRVRDDQRRSDLLTIV